MNYQEKAKDLVQKYIWEHLEITDNTRVTLDDIYVVWFCKTLQNWKCMISTTLPDGMYYEVTYDGDNEVTYIDAYKKFKNIAIPDQEE